MEKQILTFEAEKVKVSSGLFKDFVVCTAYLMSDGVNRNMSEFTKESLEKSLPTFENKPVLANIWFSRKANGNKQAYVGGHDWKIEKDENGEEYVSYKNGETPVGVITDKSNVTIQKYKGRNFVVAKLFLWKQYNPELIKILAKDKKKKVSVEIMPLKYEDYQDENGNTIRKILEFDFWGVTILGHRKDGLFGDVEAIEEGIEGSHLILDEKELENYALSYGKALKEIKDNNRHVDEFMSREENKVYSINEKRHIIIEELNNIYDQQDISLLTLYSNSLNDTIKGKFILNNTLYDFKGNINLDGSCDIETTSQISLDDKPEILRNQLEFLNSLKTDEELDINEVNLVDDIAIYDVNQLIYKIFTYCNSKEIVNLSFGVIEEGWEDNPYGNLSYPFALISKNSITFSQERIKKLQVRKLEELYNYIETIPCFQQVANMVKDTIEEKYEMGDASIVEENVKTDITETETQQEEAVVEMEKEEEKIEEEQKENDLEQKEEQAKEEVEEEGKEEQPCANEEEKSAEECECITEEKETEEKFEETPDDDKDDDDGDDEPDDKDDDDKDVDEGDEEPKEDFKALYEELSNKYSVALTQIEQFTSKVDELNTQVQNLNTQLEASNLKFSEAEKTIAKLKLEAFIAEIKDELKQSELSEEKKEEIVKMALENKFSSIVEAQKEIAFCEKQAKSESYTFVSNIFNSNKETEGKRTVFDELKKNNTW